LGKTLAGLNDYEIRTHEAKKYVPEIF